VAPDAIADPERDTSGDFREPHPEDSAEAGSPEEIYAESAPETAAERPAETVAEVPPAHERPPERQHRPERPEQRHQSEPRRPEPRPWVKPADFRPADTSAISQAVAHATEIAEALKHTIDELDEILELVEIAERQKLADEREIDELRRALRRIQPPRHQPQAPRGPRHDEPPRGYREHGPRREDSRHPRHESEPLQRPDEPPRPPDAGEPPSRVD
jgi:hypothetical protein